MSRDIKFQTEYGKDRIRKRCRLARDDMCKVIRQYEIAELRCVAELIRRNGGYLK